MTHKFEELPYKADSLEPSIDQMTMEIHYNKHHKTYFDNFINAIKDTPYSDKPLTTIFSDIAKLPPAVKNNGGGYFNHNLYWRSMHANGKKTPTGQLLKAIEAKFNNYEELKKIMQASGLARFGSGFVWLIKNKLGDLEVISTPNQNNPLMADEPITGLPLLAIDVWEHAYYLKYNNRRVEYLSAFWQVVDWSNAEELYTK